jgi:hypothetical protein
MLFKMFRYILPEWSYRPELNPEHAHEVLMRLLLVEIVRIDKENSDISLAIGARPTPPPPGEMTYYPSPSVSLSFSTSHPFGHGSNSLDHPHHSTLASSKASKKRSLPFADEPQSLHCNPCLNKSAAGAGTVSIT